jgi:formate hydrogenlyase transcriptional activator
MNPCLSSERNATELPVYTMLKPRRTPHGIVTVSFVRDMTEQKAAREMIRRQDQQLWSIVEGVRDFAV